MTRLPRSTYRLQVREAFDLDAAADVTGYLRDLGVSWAYLRFVREDDAWRPAAGTHPGWPTSAKELTLLDPCMGSGHFLVFALPILAALRMREESLSLPDAVDAVLRDNLFGLELDPRCTQLAAFNLALCAWRMGGYRTLPRLMRKLVPTARAMTARSWLAVPSRGHRVVMLPV